MPDLEDIKYVGRGGLNYDDNLAVFPPEDYRYALNCIQDEGGEYGVITNAKGNNLIDVTFGYKGANTVIGTCEDKELRAILWFVYNSRGHHSIIRYKIEQNLVEFILYDESILNFNLDYRINNPSIVGSGFRKMLFWTDNYNPPRELNIARAKSYEVATSTSTTSTYTTSTSSTSSTSTSSTSTSSTSTSSTSSSSTTSTSTFTTLAPEPMFFSVTDYDGNVYTTVVIGGQEWMMENLKVTHYADGTPIPNLTGNAAFIADTTGAYCWFDNNIAYKDWLGALYNWYACVNAHGLAPSPELGWRIPTIADWNTLIAYIGGVTHGCKLKEVGGFPFWNLPNTGATDEYGFAAIGAGNRFIDDPTGFDSIGEYADFFSSSDNGSYACSVWLFHDSLDIKVEDDFQKYFGMSVRCVRDFEYRE